MSKLLLRFPTVQKAAFNLFVPSNLPIDDDLISQIHASDLIKPALKELCDFECKFISQVFGLERDATEYTSLAKIYYKGESSLRCICQRILRKLRRVILLEILNRTIGRQRGVLRQRVRYISHYFDIDKIQAKSFCTSDNIQIVFFAFVRSDQLSYERLHRIGRLYSELYPSGRYYNNDIKIEKKFIKNAALDLGNELSQLIDVPFEFES